MTSSTFADFGLPTSLVRSLELAGFTTPTPIQAQAIPAQMEGRDILGVAQTGSGKTAAFCLPILAALLSREGRRTARTVGALILAPTRELAVQIDEMVRTYAARGHISTALVLGGVSRGGQIQKLARGVDICVATPGRLQDLMDDKKLRLDQTEFLVLDEADRMLDMGFIAPVRAIAKACAPNRRTALFSATMAPAVAKLASSLLDNPVRVEAAPQGSTVNQIEQKVIMTQSKIKRAMLNTLLEDDDMKRVIVFSRTKHGADKVAKNLAIDGHTVAAIHGNKSQNARQAALRGFRNGKVRVLVATDIAARGIDVPDISHVVNYELPDESENYVHRIGRTGRNGATGIAITLVDGSERGKLRGIERLIRKTLPKEDAVPNPNPVRPAQAQKVEFEDSRPYADPRRGPKQGGRPGQKGRNFKGRGPKREGDARPHGRNQNGRTQDERAFAKGHQGGDHHANENGAAQSDRPARANDWQPAKNGASVDGATQARSPKSKGSKPRWNSKRKKDAARARRENGGQQQRFAS